jgi:hypothetical protein
MLINVCRACCSRAASATGIRGCFVREFQRVHRQALFRFRRRGTCLTRTWKCQRRKSWTRSPLTNQTVVAAAAAVAERQGRLEAIGRKKGRKIVPWDAIHAACEAKFDFLWKWILKSWQAPHKDILFFQEANTRRCEPQITNGELSSHFCRQFVSTNFLTDWNSSASWWNKIFKTLADL